MKFWYTAGGVEPDRDNAEDWNHIVNYHLYETGCITQYDYRQYTRNWDRDL